MRKISKKKIIALILVVLAIVLTVSVTVFADTVGEDSWWVRNASVLQQNSLAFDLVRWIGWQIIRILTWFGSLARLLYDKTFGLIDITQYTEINKFLKPSWLLAITTLCLIVMGIQIMLKKEAPQFFRNIILGILAISCSLYLFTTLNNVANSFKNTVLGTEVGDIAYDETNDKIVDLIRNDKKYGVDKMNADKNELLYGAGIHSQKTLSAIDINEVLSTDEAKGKDIYKWSDKFQDYISKQVAEANVGDRNTSYLQTDVYSGLSMADGLMNNFYYRYSFNFISMLLGLISIFILYLALAYKNVRIAYDLLVSRVLSYFFSADVGGGEKLKAILCFIRDMYITLAISILSIRMFYIMKEVIDKWTGIGVVGQSIAIVFLAYVIIDGPLVAERILGIDAGLQSSMARAMIVGGAIVRGSKAVVGGVAGAVSKTGSGLNKIIKADNPNTPDNPDNNNSSFGGSDTSGTNNSSSTSNINNESSNTNDSSSGGFAMGENISFDSGSSITSINEGGFSESSSPTEVHNGYDSSFMGGDIQNTSSSFVDRGDKLSSTNSPMIKEVKKEPLNPEFSKAQSMYKPNAPRGSAEMKDYNRQITAIVRGKNHAPIKPKDNAPEYKKVNYQNALKVQEAYNKGVKSGKNSNKGKETK